MTVRNFKNTEVKKVTVVQKSMKTPRGSQYIEHIIYFTNGAVVAYEDTEHNGFIRVMEACK